MKVHTRELPIRSEVESGNTSLRQMKIYVTTSMDTSHLVSIDDGKSE